MIDMNDVIATNITNILKNKNKTRDSIAEHIGININKFREKMLGYDEFNAQELIKIAEYLNIDVKELSRIPENYTDKTFKAMFSGKVTSEQGRKALEIADELSDMIIFHSKVRKNGEIMMGYAD